MEAETDLVKIRTGSNRHKKKTLEDYENEKPPATDLLDIPDDQLTEDQKREKRRQRTQKANWDARERQRRERDEAARKAEEALRKEEEKRTNDFQGWLAAKYERRKELVEKLRARKKLKQQLQDRRSQASKARMRTVAHLAKDDEAPTKRRRKGGNDGRTQSDSAKNKDLFPPSASDDGFGRDDEDWMVYREIGGKGDESDGEEMELAELGHMDELLARFDPDFVPDDMDEEEKALRHSIVYRLAHGAFGAEESFARSKAEQAAKVHQLHLNVERMRVPEVLFQPSIIGLDQAGIVEIISEILKRVERPTQDAFMRNVLVTGTHSRYPSLVERLEKELRAIRPVGSDLVVRRAQDPRLDAWRGAAKWCLEARDELQRASMTREMYQEAGEDYLVEWRYSNRK